MNDAGMKRLREAERWTSLAGERDQLQAWLDRFWPAILAGENHMVKEDAAARVAIGGGWVVKEYRRLPGPTGWLAGWLRSRAQRVVHRGRHLKQHGLPVPDMIAWATLREAGSARKEYVITREIAGAGRLMDWLARPALAEGTRHAILDQLGALLAGFHRAGCVNRDLKDGNILVTEEDGAITLHVVDLDGVRRVPRIGMRSIRRDFWPVLHSLALYGWDTPSARQRLLGTYHAHGGRTVLPNELPQAVTCEDPTMPGWLRVERVIRMSGGVRRVSRISFPSERSEWASLGLRYWQGGRLNLEPVPGSPEAAVEMGAVDDSGRKYYFKRFFMRSKSDALKHRVRASRAARTRRGNAIAARRGLEVPQAVCMIEVRELGRPIGSAIVTEQVAGGIPLREHLEGEGDTVIRNRAERHALATQLGEEVGRWHSAGIVHGDMRHGNILVRRQGQRFHFVFVDNERTRRTTRRHERARNLVQLNMMHPTALSRRERLVFWRAYRRTAPGDGRYKRQLRLEVLAWTRRRWSRRGWDWNGKK